MILCWTVFLNSIFFSSRCIKHNLGHPNQKAPLHGTPQNTHQSFSYPLGLVCGSNKSRGKSLGCQGYWGCSGAGVREGTRTNLRDSPEPEKACGEGPGNQKGEKVLSLQEHGGNIPDQQWPWGERTSFSVGELCRGPNRGTRRRPTIASPLGTLPGMPFFLLTKGMRTSTIKTHPNSLEQHSCCTLGTAGTGAIPGGECRNTPATSASGFWSTLHLLQSGAVPTLLSNKLLPITRMFAESAFSPTTSQ